MRNNELNINKREISGLSLLDHLASDVDDEDIKQNCDNNS
jgi:hypothetical protein